MSLWEYKVITSGKGGFARPDLMEKFLNDLGREEWEIIQFHSHPDNFLAFTGLARRSTQRDWTLEDAAAAAAKVEAEKLRAEFEAKFKAAATPAPSAAAEERTPSFLEEKAAPEDGLRKLVDTSRDDDPEAEEDEKADEWDKLTAAEADELPSFFEAIRPHMRRNQRGPGMSVGVDYLAKKWDLAEDDLKTALAECGFVVPADEDSPVQHLEYDGDLFWLNINRRGELWINTKEKPRPVFRAVRATRIEVETPKPEAATPTGESAAGATGDGAPSPSQGGEAPAASAATPAETSKAPGSPLPEGTSLLDKIRPHMRRNRRGPGGSGSATFLSRALRTNETELRTAFATLGFTLPASSADKPVYAEFGQELWWLNLDSRGGLWINGREKKDGETLATASAEASAATSPNAAETPASVPADGTAAPGPAATDAGAPVSPESTSVLSPASEPSGETTPAPTTSAPAEVAPASSPGSTAETPAAPAGAIAPEASADIETAAPAATEPRAAGADGEASEEESAKKPARRPIRSRPKKAE